MSVGAPPMVPQASAMNSIRDQLVDFIIYCHYRFEVAGVLPARGASPRRPIRRDASRMPSALVPRGGRSFVVEARAVTVGYTRLSIGKYDDQLGVARQREDIAALARSLGWPEVTEWYEDNDVSANVEKRRPRPEFDRLLPDMRAGALSHVLCYDQDRLVRDMRQLEDVVEAVEAGRVMLTSVNGDIDLLTDNGRMVARIKAAVARKRN